MARLAACSTGPTASGGIKAALDRAIEIGADAAQLFAQSPRMWRFPEHDPADLARFRERRAEAGLGAVLVHALYLCNLADPGRDALRQESRDDALDRRRRVSRSRPTASSSTSARTSGPASRPASSARVPALEQVLEHCSETTWLLLENSAGAGGTIGRSLEELAELFDALGRHPQLGLCLDSCHLCVSGVDVSEPDAVAATIDELDERIGLDRLRALHVNDAAAPLGSNRDRHANVLEGELGERLGAFLAHPAVQSLPAVMETPGPDGHGPDARGGAEAARPAPALDAQEARPRTSSR